MQSPQMKTRTLITRFILILFLVAVFVSGCVINRNGRGYGPYSSRTTVQPRVKVAVPAPVTFTFTDHHRHTVQNYYHHHHHGKKHKHRKKWKYKRKSRLPRGMLMRVVPVDLARQLPPAPRGTRYIYDDEQVLLVDTRTRAVLDFINISISDEPRVVVAVPPPITFTFNNHHRHMVSDYYHRHPRHHHGKKHKHKKKWRHKRRARLHSRVHMQTIPFELTSQLPPAPRGTQFIQDDDQILLIDENTYEVLDFINIPDWNEPRVAVAIPAPVIFTFNDHHRHTVREYYHRHPHHHGKKHKHKKNKRKKRWKHKRKAHLNSQIQMHVIPVDLIRQLPPAPRGTRFIYNDDQVLLVDTRSRVVLDFINIEIPNEPQNTYIRERAPIANPIREHPRNHHSSSHPPKVAKSRQAPPQEAKVHFDFDDRQRNLILKYFTHGKGLKKFKKIQKKAKKVSWVKKVQKDRPSFFYVKNEIYAGTRTPIPAALKKQLPPLPKTIKRVIYGAQILLVDWPSKRVLDTVDLPVEM